MVMIGGHTRTSLGGVKTSLPSSCDHAETLTCTTTASVPLFLTVTATLRFAGERAMRIGLTSNEPAFAPRQSADTRKNRPRRALAQAQPSGLCVDSPKGGSRQNFFLIRWLDTRAKSSP